MTTISPPATSSTRVETAVTTAVTAALAEFAFDDGPLTNHVVAFTVTGLSDRPITVNVNPDADPGTRSTAPPVPVDDLFDPWHEAWNEPAERLATLTGPWLHPHTRFQVTDPPALASGAASLLIGCVDRNDPTAGRPLWDPTLDPFFNDIGVIGFPVSPAPMVAVLSDGYTGRTAGTWGACIAVVCAAAHEAMELTQISPGVPVIDPHASDVSVTVTVNNVDGSPLFGWV